MFRTVKHHSFTRWQSDDEIRERSEYIPADTDLTNPDPRSIQQKVDEALAETDDETIRERNNITDEPTEFVEKLSSLERAGVT